MNKNKVKLSLLLIGIIVGILIYRNYFIDTYALPSGETQEIIIETKDGVKTIMETNGVKHSIPFIEFKFI